MEYFSTHTMGPSSDPDPGNFYTPAPPPPHSSCTVLAIIANKSSLRPPQPLVECGLYATLNKGGRTRRSFPQPMNSRFQ